MAKDGKVNRGIHLMLNFFFAFLLPLIMIVSFVYWTLKIRYTRRFLPTIMLILLAILILFVPSLLVSKDVLDGGFEIAIQSVYFSISLGVGTVVNIIVAIFIRKNKESSIPL